MSNHANSNNFIDICMQFNVNCNTSRLDNMSDFKLIFFKALVFECK